MKITFALSSALLLVLTPIAPAQDPETEEQIKKANEAAKSLGVKMPDIHKLMEQSALDDAADEASNEAATKAGAEKEKTEKTTKAANTAATRFGLDLPAGTAKGSITFDGATAELKFATAFVDQKDDRKPVVLVVSDQKLPAEKWTSEFDMMRDQTKWSGFVAFIDKEGTVYRTDVHTKGRQSSVSGIFDVKLNDPTNPDLGGMAKTDSNTKEDKLDVTFHAVWK